LEHFYDSCGGVIGWLDRETRYIAFIEGWELYAESPLISDTDVYDDKPLAKYGMLRSQVRHVSSLMYSPECAVDILRVLVVFVRAELDHCAVQGRGA